MRAAARSADNPIHSQLNLSRFSPNSRYACILAMIAVLAFTALVELQGFPTVAALYERRQCSSLDIAGGHRPPLQMKLSHHPKPLKLGVQGLSVVSFAVNSNRDGGLK